MKDLLRKFFLIPSLGLSSIIAFSLPGNASVFYDLEFFDEEGQLAGTGEFSHEEPPFEGTIDLCFVESICGTIPLEITADENFFRLDSFSSTIPFLSFPSFPIEDERIDLFWQPFENQVAGTFFQAGCASFSCAGRVGFSEDSWLRAVQRVGSARMTATEWSVSSSFFVGSGTWTATRRTSIPEPVSSLGLLAFGALGIGSRLKRKSNSPQD